MNAIIRNRFPAIAAAAVGAVIFAGFARTYYLRFLFDAPPLTVAAHLHGLVATAWVVLYVVQTRLIAAHRVEVHRRLGIVTACLGFVMAGQGLLLGVAAAAAGHAPPGRDPLEFLSVPITTSTVFSAFMSAALLLRRKREWHKRLMFLAALVLLVPAIGRFDFLVMQPLGLPRALLGLITLIVFVAWAWWNDWRRSKRVHAAYLYGGPVLIVCMRMGREIGFMEWWRPVAEWLVR
jgi:hypothetical protein